MSDKVTQTDSVPEGTHEITPRPYTRYVAIRNRKNPQRKVKLRLKKSNTEETYFELLDSYETVYREVSELAQLAEANSIAVEGILAATKTTMQHIKFIPKKKPKLVSSVIIKRPIIIGKSAPEPTPAPPKKPRLVTCDPIVEAAKQRKSGYTRVQTGIRREPREAPAIGTKKPHNTE